MFKELYNKIKDGVMQMMHITCNELSTIFHDSGVMIIFFAASLLYPVLYSFVYMYETVREVPIGIVDHSNSEMSRRFIRKVDATPDLKVVSFPVSSEDAQQKFQKREIFGFMVIPSDFSDKIAKGEQASVLVFANMSSLMYYKVMYVAGNYACIDLGREIQSERLGMVGVVGKRFDAVINAVPHEGHSLYNSKNGFSSYLLPPVLVLIIQQTLLIGIGILVGMTREENLFHRLIPLQKKYHGTLRIVLGKANAYLLLYVFIASFVLLFVPYAFNFPQLLSPSTFYAFLFPYLLACIFFGMTVSVFFRNREMPFLLLVFTSLLFLFLSGYAWPTSNIHPVWRAISMLIPSTPGVQAFLKINSMGASLKQIAPEYFTLLVQMGVYFITACLVYRWQIIRNK